MSLQVDSIEWLAGLWEAEGTFAPIKKRTYPEVKLSMTDFDVVEYAQSLIGLGRLYTMYRQPDAQDQRRWIVYRKSETYEMMKLLYPYMFSRRAAKIREVSDIETPYKQPIINMEWLAGWLEGEGCFCVKHRIYPAVEVSTTDYDVIESARDFIGAGNIRKQKLAQPHHKQKYLLGLYGSNARNLMDNIYPMMGQRRQEKIREIYPGVIK